MGIYLNPDNDSFWETVHSEIYVDKKEGYTGEILLVGINYDKEKVEKPHSYVIERLEKL